MPKVRSGFAKKWVENASRSTSSYESGVQNPRNDWADATEAAQENYETGIQDAIADKRFAKGVRKAGTSKWKNNTLEKGPERFAQGVRLSESEFSNGIQPFIETIENTTLPPRFPKGDPRNLDRVRVMAEALRQKKLQG
jgi:hypothetical protein